MSDDLQAQREMFAAHAIGRFGVEMETRRQVRWADLEARQAVQREQWAKELRRFDVAMCVLALGFVLFLAVMAL